ncbi:MAG TPA: hypothetical protein DCY48_01380 [Candidatus Magasanikbacteria bacterium]|nr:MAG: hypothetical protein A3I74_03845 [Candidatus Magasanikbacteria bacterium RIFCSPLOWO2_02_FULL_47_16]OGH79300.1 MAG: hypothetical protein A3C10_04385 [Candidatus Magasanikbacteria bacterium RIFCSPHIGHO2_02_FULL_48_18]OGH82213.1 MAG: hypothetical protein A3G08_00940 [Candidatus Magasanikbacteria bacterium RIFCSPLOWO2_12_FULL_47_9b]HAZ28410.1 hypothetical protein [Candidatus Magasanikbacteria bacterium]
MIRVVMFGIGAVAGVVSSLCLFLIHHFANLLALAIVLVAWVGILFSIYHVIEKRIDADRRQFFLILATVFGFLGFTSLVEALWLRYFLIVLSGVCIGLLFVLLLYHRIAPVPVQKSIRRIGMMVWVFDAYALTTTVFAFHLFFQSFPFWALSFLNGIILAVIGSMIWRLYVEGTIRTFLFWIGFVAVLMTEITFAIQIFPLGYLALGLFTTWIWYIVQLFIRFHIHYQGVVWHKQRWFLIVNVLLFAAGMFFVRWI